MKKYLLTIEFRYSSPPRSSLDCTLKNKEITFGVYDDFQNACKKGNELMEKLESMFPLHKFPDESTPRKERFSKNGGPFGSKVDLISNTAYLKTPFLFFARIKTLVYEDIEDVVNGVVKSVDEYKTYKKYSYE